MQDKLAIIKRIRDEHQTIKGHVKLVGDEVGDIKGQHLPW